MTSSKSAAWAALVEVAATTRYRIEIDDVLNAAAGETSRRTVRRVLKEAEELGMVEKRIAHSNSWTRGPRLEDALRDA